ncbi:hypothetical protein BCR42DRAFT_426489 [Absidia repens]|uniref:Uncharacterized protein n=1 Tax=Absidia repens TaxID=90262 RepID=A0A1X2I1C4_9FUNG|nr:hypothetical protein BCR42DRAFT_426489 [Absidia repens]
MVLTFWMMMICPTTTKYRLICFIPLLVYIFLCFYIYLYSNKEIIYIYIYIFYSLAK